MIVIAAGFVAVRATPVERWDTSLQCAGQGDQSGIILNHQVAKCPDAGLISGAQDLHG